MWNCLSKLNLYVWSLQCKGEVVYIFIFKVLGEEWSWDRESMEKELDIVMGDKKVFMGFFDKVLHIVK